MISRVAGGGVKGRGRTGPLFSPFLASPHPTPSPSSRSRTSFSRKFYATVLGFFFSRFLFFKKKNSVEWMIVNGWVCSRTRAGLPRKVSRGTGGGDGGRESRSPRRRPPLQMLSPLYPSSPSLPPLREARKLRWKLASSATYSSSFSFPCRFSPRRRQRENRT